MDTSSLVRPGRQLEPFGKVEELPGILEIPERPLMSAGYADIYCGIWITPQGQRVQVAVKELRTPIPKDRRTGEEALKTKVDTIYQAACGLEHLHSRVPPICHADIKPENVLINDSKTATLSDFGLSRVVQDLEARSGFTTSETTKGTMIYMAGEIFNGQKPNLASDVYAFGGFILTVMSGKPPFHGLLPPVYICRVVQDKPPLPEHHPTLPAHDSLWELMRRCWAKDSTARPKMREVMELLEQIIHEESNPQSRPDPASLTDDGAYKGAGVQPRHLHRYSRSSGNIRADSMGDPGGIMGVPRSDFPNPIEDGYGFPFDREDYSMAVEGGRERDMDRSLGVPRQELERRSRQTAEEGDHERMDVDWNVDPRLLEAYERDYVDEFLTTTLDISEDDNRSGRGGLEGEERDELQEDREMSPMSDQVARAQAHGGQHLERWRAVDREQELRQREDEQRADSGPQMQYASSNGLVNIKNDQFRYYSTPEQLKQQHSPSTSPHLSSSHPQPQHGSTYPPPAFQTLAMQHGQLQQIRRGTIAGIVTTPNPRDEFAYQARASYSGPSHSRRPSGDGPSSSGLSPPSLVGHPSDGSGPHIIYPHSQQRRQPGPGLAVKPTLNAQGQRTCGRCGRLGRYKDGKCVERWGPGPAGPGTLCERCRKKMKRDERRRIQDAGSLG